MALFDYFSYDLQRHTNKTLKKTYIEVSFVGEVSELTGSNLHLHEVLLMPLIEPVLTIGETRLVQGGVVGQLHVNWGAHSLMEHYVLFYL